ncbi:branched-chain amino acid ABC transporter permease [Dactylosporangium matsuzakiense]|uniref:Branched-chain amino acid ABC transporter permease n=1 Tax=Dactylosporangium matsuzakiense TaxID=53360 RepID=A0A9W6NKT6_9ACTN|nr:branched-chain amino acid ABC transporter permease [Dactylosporangium matsuzakiense]UWZ46050.1 branched-chain amino acid ABC transporter permease [Dactylosporangium matsuzakiense]GLL00177.1 branched-chain amino acid ABC transporter permease [Dactylosporangium matsuzakiense]
MRNRPLLHTAYAQDIALFGSTVQRSFVALGLLVALAMPFLVQDDVLQLLGLACVTAVGALGLNIVTGLAGQVSLGHAFFLAIGAYTAAALAGDPDGRTIGFGVTEILIWLPAAGLVAALAGMLVAPLATRLRGLYLAVVTLGLVFIGGHIINGWSELTGGPGVGRQPPAPSLLGYDLNTADGWLTRDQKLYLLMLVLLLIGALAARNLARSRVGRALTAIRDRDIAAGVIGVNLARYKTVAFGVSSFYAGCAGALLYVGAGYFDPTSFDLLLSVQYIAMILIGGAGTVSGAVLGAFLITLLPRLTRELPALLPFISSSPAESPNAYQLETVLYGVLIIVFLIFEPRGLFGIWIRLRNYWKAWPFSY